MAAGKCQNCGHALSCGCQRRTASDGKAVCSNCIALYEKQLQQIKQANIGKK